MWLGGAGLNKYLFSEKAFASSRFQDKISENLKYSGFTDHQKRHTSDASVAKNECHRAVVLSREIFYSTWPAVIRAPTRSPPPHFAVRRYLPRTALLAREAPPPGALHGNHLSHSRRGDLGKESKIRTST